MRPHGTRRAVRDGLAAGMSWMCAVSVVVGLAVDGSAAEFVRKQIEDDWRRQDECRMAEIREPGLVRFVSGEVNWPGVKTDDRLRVPKKTAPRLDGNLDDACWRGAAVVPSGAADRPSLRLVRDNRGVYVGISLPTSAEARYRGDPTALDAGGAVDGVKNGRYAFHTGSQPNPWWQVDLGRSQSVARIVVYNRLDYAPGLHNADNLTILTSDDGEKWTLRYDNKGKYFGGVGKGKPLTVDFAKLSKTGRASPIRVRFIRLRIRSNVPIFFHLDEVEVFGPESPGKNIALRCPARQSSLSIWSRGKDGDGSLLVLGGVRIGLARGKSSGVAVNGSSVSSERAGIRREGGRTTVEVALPLAGFPGGFPGELRSGKRPVIGLTRGGDWRIEWAPTSKLGFGGNRLAVKLDGAGLGNPPVEVSVETVVFTPLRPERQIVFRKKVAAPGSIPVAFQIHREGPAAVIVTARQGKVSVRNGKTFMVEPVRDTLQRAHRLLVDGRGSTIDSAAAIEARANALAAREKAGGADPDARRALYLEARWLARRVVLDGLKRQFDKLLLVKRFTQETYPDVCLNHMPWTSRPGGDICVVSMGGHDGRAEVRNLLNGALGPGHVHGADLWWEADRVVFGYARTKSDKPSKGWRDRRTNFELRRNEKPIHLYEIGVDGSGLRQLTRGEWSDLDPTYLASGDIAFVSERCGCSLQCNEYDKDETSCNLYVMRPDGGNIRQLSVSKDGDYLPHALSDGTIGYTRWEYQERGWAHIQSIWTVRPDGTGADALFKQHMNNPWSLEDVRSIPDTSKLVAVATGHHTLAAGPVVIVSPDSGLNNARGIGIVTPGVLPPEGGMAGTPVEQGGVTGRGGFYMTPWPLSEESFLVSYTFGKQTDPNGYAIYLIDVHGTKELVYRDPKISCFVPIPLRPRPRPPVLADAREVKDGYAVCAVANVSHGVEGVAPESIRYIRISTRDQWPYCNTYGGQRYEKDVKSVMINWTPARVIGTVPVEADGSACFRLPADTPVYFQLLDENHMELRRMRSFISFQPGEVRGCVGCHETRAEAPPNRAVPTAMRREPRIPIPPPWGNRAISFLRDVQPVLDRHCVRCHGGLKPPKALDFSGGLTPRYNRAYDTILAHRLVARSNVGDDARITKPLAFGSHKSRLISALRNARHRQRVELGRNDWLTFVTWIDLNAPYHDAFINKRLAYTPYDLPTDRALVGKIEAVHAKRCGACHDPAEVTRLDWIDIRSPVKSLFLSAPLAGRSDGARRCKKPVYKDRNDSDYQTVLRLVEAAAQQVWERPRRDLRALAPALGPGREQQASARGKPDTRYRGSQ